MFTIHHFRSVTSTSDVAKRYPKKSIILADIQTRGRGRLGREWSSKPGGIWMSVVLEPTENPLYHLTFLASVAVREAISTATGVQARIKWPNDLLYEKKKLCGILTEGFFIGNEKKLIVGIGLNVNNAVPGIKKTPAIALRDITKKSVSRKKLIAHIVAQLEQWHLLYASIGFLPVLLAWKANNAVLGQRIKIHKGKTAFTATPVDVDEDGNLIVMQGENKQTVTDGDILLL